MGRRSHGGVVVILTLEALYYLTVGFFFTHELDAVKRREWRLLPGLRFLPEKLGEQLFIWLHVPILALLLVGGEGEDVNAVRTGLAGFAVVHVGLHWMFRNHPSNEFNNPSSWALILGAGAFGAAYLIAVGRA
jgi:hypothetical protein